MSCSQIGMTATAPDHHTYMHVLNVVTKASPDIKKKDTNSQKKSNSIASLKYAAEERWHCSTISVFCMSKVYIKSDKQNLEFLHPYLVKFLAN